MIESLKAFIKNLQKSQSSNTPPIGKTVVFGFTVLIIFVGGLALWSFIAPLDTAAIAPGKVTVDTNRKTIQHLEGGIVKTLHVREGSKVNAGDPLITLDDTQAQAKYDILKGQADELLALEARLIAERDKAKTIAWPDRLLKEKNKLEINKILKSQQAIFTANNNSLNGQMDILKQRIKQLEKQIEALQAQVKSETRQLELIEEEIKAVKFLEQRKLIEKPRLLALQREAARLMGNRGEHLGLIAKAQQQIGETQQRLITLQDDNLQKILTALSDAQRKLADILERETAAKDILHRTVITAPKSGTVVGLKIHTVGGVVVPGNPILDIVPSQDKLVIEAEISPLDIDAVYPGLLAKVRLTAYKSRNTPTLIGKVVRVSPDSFTDSKTGNAYYVVRVSIPTEQLQKYPHLSLYPGMPVQVMIVTDKQTAFNYLIQPLKDSFNKAFREQ